jgi:hypothetical protein
MNNDIIDDVAVFHERYRVILNDLIINLEQYQRDARWYLDRDNANSAYMAHFKKSVEKRVEELSKDGSLDAIKDYSSRLDKYGWELCEMCKDFSEKGTELVEEFNNLSDRLYEPLDIINDVLKNDVLKCNEKELKIYQSSLIFHQCYGVILDELKKEELSSFISNYDVGFIVEAQEKLEKLKKTRTFSETMKGEKTDALEISV